MDLLSESVDMKEMQDPGMGCSHLELLLLGKNKEEFAPLCELVRQTGDEMVSFDHVSTTDEALAHLQQRNYDLLLCDYKSGSSPALHLVHEIRKNGRRIHILFLSDYLNQPVLPNIIQSEAGNGDGSGLNGPPPRESAIRSVIETYCKERQHQKAEIMLRKLWRAVEQSADLIIVTDRSGVIEYVNPRFEAVTGYSRQEAVGHTFHLLKPNDQPLDFDQIMWQTVHSGNVFRGAVGYRKKNGDAFVVEKHITPLRDLDGEITNFVSNDWDITEQRKLESQLQQSQKMDAIGLLAGGIAHDFNNLLMIISSYAELMIDTLSAEHPLRRNVQQILIASRRAADLTRQLLAFSRKQMQALQLMDLNSVVKEICGMLPRLIGEDIQLVIVPGKNVGRIKADPVQIEQVIMNLAANGRDAMPNGGKLMIETASVHLDDAYVQRRLIVPKGDYVLLTVTDSGEGIAPEHQAHIFEPFYTTKAAGKGTGLGLATVYGIVKQNDGFIWAYSEVGMGTTFKIYLPCAQQVDAKLPSKTVPEKSSQGCETIFLVEDEEAVRQSACEFLTMNGYTVLEAGNGEEALLVSRNYTRPIHLMVSDVVMPKMGGAQLAKLLTVERPDMKVLFVSGYAENTVLQHGKIDMTNGFLQKPFTLKTLAQKIREVLQRNAAAASAASN